VKTMPGADHVDQALKSVERRVANALKRINRLAGKLLAHGDYTGSESLVQIARAVQEFQSEIVALQNKWKSLTQIPKSKKEEKNDITPLWEYYRPILTILEELGGDASRYEIEDAFEKGNLAFIKDGDRAIMKSGLPRWKIMIHRARKPMIKEGFLDANAKGRWRITSLGRQTVKGKNQGNPE